MEAVIFGAGNIGRGFIGALFSNAGLSVTFIDVADSVVEKINADHCYPLTIVSSEGKREVTVDKISAVNGNDASRCRSDRGVRHRRDLRGRKGDKIHNPEFRPRCEEKIRGIGKAAQSPDMRKSHGCRQLYPFSVRG